MERIYTYGFSTQTDDELRIEAKSIWQTVHHINEYGLQFGYGLIDDPESVPFNFFYTSNVSLPRALLVDAGLFDTSFPHAAWEDIEVAYRLMKGGMRMLYRPAAVARHHHDITFSSFRRRQEKAGEAAAIFYEKHPELGDFLAVPLARTLPDRVGPLYRMLPFWAALSERRELPGGRRAVDRVLRDDYLRGLKRGGWRLGAEVGALARSDHRHRNRTDARHRIRRHSPRRLGIPLPQVASHDERDGP